MPSDGDYNHLKQEIEDLRGQIAALRNSHGPGSTNSTQGAESSTDDPAAIAEHGTAVAPARHRFRRTVAAVRRRPYYLLPVLLLLAGLAYGAYWAWNYFHSYETTSDAEISGSISPVGSKVVGAVSKVLVQNGQTVKAGQSLVELDPEPYRLAVKIARAKYDAAKAAAEIARHNYDTLTDAGKHPTILSRTAEKAKASLFAARQMVNARSAAEEGAEAALDAAQLKLHYTTLTAPVSGIVAESSVNIGQDVQPAQRLMAIVQTTPLWVTAKIKETQLRQLHQGQAVTLHVDALEGNYIGQIASIAPATASEFSLMPSENATGNYMSVVQRIGARIDFKPGQNLARLRPGMSVEATIWMKHG